MFRAFLCSFAFCRPVVRFPSITPKRRKAASAYSVRSALPMQARTPRVAAAAGASSHDVGRVSEFLQPAAAPRGLAARGVEPQVAASSDWSASASPRRAGCRRWPRNSVAVRRLASPSRSRGFGGIFAGAAPPGAVAALAARLTACLRCGQATTRPRLPLHDLICFSFMRRLLTHSPVEYRIPCRATGRQVHSVRRRRVHRVLSGRSRSSTARW